MKKTATSPDGFFQMAKKIVASLLRIIRSLPFNLPYMPCPDKPHLPD
jgi:hypothetical protein